MRKFMVCIKPPAKVKLGPKICRNGAIVTEEDLIGVPYDTYIRRGILIELYGDGTPLPDPVISEANDPVWRSGKLKLAIVTGVWKRPEVFEIFARKTNELHHNDVDIVVIIAGSEGATSQQMVERHGFKYMEIQNNPLAHKMNCTTQLAGKYGVDYVLCVGSDDIITQPLLDVYVEQMKKGIDFVGVIDWYFYDTTSKQYSYWGGYIDDRRGHTCGAGRLISAKLMKVWNWKPWKVEHSHVLDNSMQNELKKIKHKSYTFKLKDKGIFAVDIKSSTNMTPFELWPNTQLIEPTKELKRCVE